MGSLVGVWVGTLGSRVQVQLLGRSGRAASSPLLAAMQASPAGVIMERCDVARTEEAAAVLRHGTLPLAGIVHAGGVLADAKIPDQTAGGLRSVFAPKVRTCPETGTHSSEACQREGTSPVPIHRGSCLSVSADLERRDRSWNGSQLPDTSFYKNI